MACARVYVLLKSQLDKIDSATGIPQVRRDRRGNPRVGDAIICDPTCTLWSDCMTCARALALLLDKIDSATGIPCTDVLIPLLSLHSNLPVFQWDLCEAWHSRE